MNQLVLHVEQLADQRLGRPLDKTSGGHAQAPGAETQRSANSLTDIVHDIEGLGNLWFGRYEGNEAVGLDELVAVASPASRQAVDQAIADLETAVAAIAETLVATSASTPTVVEMAFERARALRVLLLTDVVGSLGSTLGFNPNDGD